MSDTSNNIEDNYFYDKYKKRGMDFPSFLRLRYFVFIFAIFAIFYWLFLSAPINFPKSKIVSIPNGTSLVKVGNILEENSIIKSPLFFRIMVRFFDGATSVKAGDYLFEKRQNVISVASRLTEGERGFKPAEVVIPEGTAVKEIAEILEKQILNFDEKEFLKIAGKYEGYLFPDTYIFAFDAGPADVLEAFLITFDERIGSIKKEIESFGRPVDDVIKMASIVEEEGRTTDTRRKIAGILWDRLSIGMPLQVDASFKYINGKTTFELTTEDLLKDDPYNTYTRKGLPPTPITNPGLDSILATITPIKTPYLYYLTDKDGVMRYARTHEEHVVNKERYLR